MKRMILLMRHAKSSWNNPRLRDFDRPLNSRGKKDAPRMGGYLKNMGAVPQRIISSPAARAKATILHVADAMNIDHGLIEWDETLYFTGPYNYIEAIKNTDDSLHTVMTVGHNPMTEEVISMLADTPVLKHIATATVACFETDITSWKDLGAGTCTINWVVSPKDI